MVRQQACDLQPRNSRRAFLALAGGSVLGLPRAQAAGLAVPQIYLASLDGKSVNFAAAEKKLTVVWFVSCNCPIVKDYLDRMEQLIRQYQPQDVRFLLVNANGNEPVEQVEDFAAAIQMPVPIYLDRGHVVADLLHAHLTPEAFLLNRQGEVIYRGAVDDHRNQARVRVRPLALAIAAGLAGRRPPYAEWRSFGCTIKRRAAK